MKKLITVVTAVLASFGIATAAMAIPLAGFPGIVTGANTVSDDNFEFLIDSGPGPVGVVGVGDILIGAVGINFINGTAAGVFDRELTVIYALETTSVAAAAPIACLNLASASCSSFTFGAIGSGGSGFADINAVLAATLGLGPYFDPTDGVSPLAAGTVGLLFVDPAKNFVSPDVAGTTLAALFASADGGQALLGATLGIGAGGVFGSAPASLLELTSLDPTYAPGQTAGIISISLSVLQQKLPGFTITSDLIGPSSVSEPSATNPSLQNMGIRTDTTLNFTAQVVPEPATLSLIGISLLGLAFMSRRRPRKGSRS